MDNNKEIERFSYIEFDTPNILSSSKYEDSLKNLSYSYRYKGDDEAFSYISMKKEDDDKGLTCTVLDLHIDTNIGFPRYEQIYEEIELRIIGWKFDNDKFFDYIKIERNDKFNNLIDFFKRSIDCNYEETTDYVRFSL